MRARFRGVSLRKTFDWGKPQDYNFFRKGGVDIMFKAAHIIMALNADPAQHRALIKSDVFEYTMVVTPLFDFDQAARICKELVENEGVQWISLCPGFSHEAVAKIRNAVGDGVAITVSRGDVTSTLIVDYILTKEGWLPPGH